MYAPIFIKLEYLKDVSTYLKHSLLSDLYPKVHNKENSGSNF